MLLTNSNKMPIRPGYSYEVEAGGLFCKEFVFTHPTMELVRVYVVWQEQHRCWLAHIKDRQEFRIIPTLGVLAAFMRKVLEQRMPVWWWKDGDDYVGFAFPTATAKTQSEDPGVAPR